MMTSSNKGHIVSIILWASSRFVFWWWGLDKLRHFQNEINGRINVHLNSELLPKRISIQ